MYHFEFYRKILAVVGSGVSLVSGIIGDAWAGSVNIAAIDSPEAVKFLGYTHGLTADSTKSLFSSSGSCYEEYYSQKRERLKDDRMRVIESMRFKMILLCYLMALPRAFGFRPWSPFLDIEVAMGMLNLSPERRRNRLWQRELFRNHGLNVEEMGLPANQSNELDIHTLRCYPVAPLNARVLREVVQPDYVEKINQDLRHRPYDSTIAGLLKTRRVGGVLRRLRLSDPSVRSLNAYSAYVVLKPIENLLKRRGFKT
jgi:hypothetical protein